jgi:prevent-host-death family protein
MRTFTIDDAKEQLTMLVDAVQGGEDILIGQAGRPVARLTRVLAENRRVGDDDGKISIPADFDRWIPAEFEPYL